MASQPFVPKTGEEAFTSFAPTPTYLFRLYTPKSGGRTSIKHVLAPAYPDNPKEPHPKQCSCCEDLLQCSPSMSASMLSSHLWWECGNSCNLMSWSSSLLFVLQHGLYRHEHRRDGSPLSEAFIIMLDTRRFPERTFLRDVDAIEYYHKLTKIDSNLKTIKGWRASGQAKYFGEYLTQGSLDIEGHCCQVSMQQLIDTGLSKLCPFVEDDPDWARLARAVCSIRSQSFHTPETNHEQVRLAISMALVNMEARFAFPFAAMLLSLQARDTTDEFTLNEFHSSFTDQQLNNVDITYDVDIYDWMIRMKEVDQFKRLVEAIREKKSVDSVDQISQTFQNLSVANTAKGSVATSRRRVVPRH